MNGSLEAGQRVVLVAGLAFGFGLIGSMLVWKHRGSLAAAGALLGLAIAGSTLGQSSVDGQWFGQGGRPLYAVMNERSITVVAVGRGPSHCSWEDTSFLSVAIPLGSPAISPKDNDRIYTYLGYPGSFMLKDIATGFESETSLPADATYTGFHRGNWQLYVSPAQLKTAVWLKSGDVVQRWPYEKTMFGCE